MADAPPDITEHPCKMAADSVWYQFTAFDHTVGVSAEPGRTFTPLIEETDGQITLSLVDDAGEVAAATGITKAAG